MKKHRWMLFILLYEVHPLHRNAVLAVCMPKLKQAAGGCGLGLPVWGPNTLWHRAENQWSNSSCVSKLCNCQNIQESNLLNIPVDLVVKDRRQAGQKQAGSNTGRQAENQTWKGQHTQTTIWHRFGQSPEVKSDWTRAAGAADLCVWCRWSEEERKSSGGRPAAVAVTTR